MGTPQLKRDASGDGTNEGAAAAVSPQLDRVARASARADAERAQEGLLEPIIWSVSEALLFAGDDDTAEQCLRRWTAALQGNKRVAAGAPTPGAPTAVKGTYDSQVHEFGPKKHTPESSTRPLVEQELNTLGHSHPPCRGATGGGFHTVSPEDSRTTKRSPLNIRKEQDEEDVAVTMLLNHPSPSPPQGSPQLQAWTRQRDGQLSQPVPVDHDLDRAVDRNLRDIGNVSHLSKPTTAYKEYAISSVGNTRRTYRRRSAHINSTSFEGGPTARRGWTHPTASVSHDENTRCAKDTMHSAEFDTRLARQEMAQLEAEKKDLKQLLRSFDQEFEQTYNRAPNRAEKQHLRPQYSQYHRLKLRIAELKELVKDPFLRHERSKSGTQLQAAGTYRLAEHSSSPRSYDEALRSNC
eukprot:scaffold4163_cov425-Prasinococcus_capsulatus_cf.AAC.10